MNPAYGVSMSVPENYGPWFLVRVRLQFEEDKGLPSARFDVVGIVGVLRGRNQHYTHIDPNGLP